MRQILRSYPWKNYKNFNWNRSFICPKKYFPWLKLALWSRIAGFAALNLWTDQTTTWHDWPPCPDRQLQLWSYCYKSRCTSLYFLLYFVYHIFKNADDGLFTLQLATEFLKQLPGILKKPEFSTNGNYLRKMRIDLAKSILADTGKTGTAPQGVRENDSSPNIDLLVNYAVTMKTNC